MSELGFCPMPSLAAAPSQLWAAPGLAGSDISLAGGAMVLAGLLNKIDYTNAVLSAISLGSSYRWYLKLTQFESLFVLFFILEIFVGRYLGFFPFSMHDFFYGKPNGRKRKRRDILNPKLNDRLIEGLLNLLKKLDDQDCFPKSLCVLESEQARGTRLPELVSRFLSTIKTVRRYSEDCTPGLNENELGDQLEEDQDSMKLVQRRINVFSGLSPYTQAISFGETDFHRGGNSSLCESEYKGCSMPREDVLYYYQIIANAGLAK